MAAASSLMWTAASSRCRGRLPRAEAACRRPASAAVITISPDAASRCQVRSGSHPLTSAVATSAVSVSASQCAWENPHR